MFREIALQDVAAYRDQLSTARSPFQHLGRSIHACLRDGDSNRRGEAPNCDPSTPVGSSKIYACPTCRPRLPAETKGLQLQLHARLVDRAGFTLRFLSPNLTWPSSPEPKRIVGCLNTVCCRSSVAPRSMSSEQPTATCGIHRA